MSEIFQKTLSETIAFSGIGLHSGKRSNIKLIPADEDSGIVFKRTDLTKNNTIKANFENVTSARLCTTLENKSGVKVSTVEHLLAAIYIAGIDNAIIEIDNDEVPIMDGSSKDFLNAINETQIKIQSKKRKYLKVTDIIELEDGNRKIAIEPHDTSLEVSFKLNYDNEIIGNQQNVVNFYKDNLEDVSSSRIFCLYEDIEKIKKAGLAKGGSLDNAVVVAKDKVLNEEGLRNKKEFVNHKILDLAGDFMLSGYRIIGKVKCVGGGHELTNMLIRKIFKTNFKFSVIELDKILFKKINNTNEQARIAVNA